MPSIRLITDQAKIHYCEKNSLINFQSFIAPFPTGKFFVVGFCEHATSGKQIHPLVKELIEQDIGVVYVCDILPSNIILDNHIIYIETGWNWFIHTLFTNPFLFKASFFYGQGERLSKAFSTFTQFKIPQITSVNDIENVEETFISSEKSVLFYIEGGVGDHLLTTPTLKTFKSKGYKVGILADKHRMSCYDNLDFIDKKYFSKSEINIGKWECFYHLHFGRILNDYSLPLNQQNRIFAVANLCRLDESELVVRKPIINLTLAEKRMAKDAIGSYSDKIFFGFDSARHDAKYPKDLIQPLIDKLHSKGYTVVISSLEKKNYKNCLNFTGNRDNRFLFALINECDLVLTVDSCFLHIAAAFNKPTILLPSTIRPDWRASTYENCKWIEPRVPCYYCLHGQRTPHSERLCKNGKLKCFYSIPQSEIVNKLIEIHKPTRKSRIKGKIINFPIFIQRNKERKLKIGMLWQGGLGDSVMLSYIARAAKRKYPDSYIDCFVRDKAHTQVFVFDYPDIMGKCSGEYWHKTFKLYKDKYDIFYEFRHFPYVWYNNGIERNPEFNKLLYDDWFVSAKYMLKNVSMPIWEYYAKQVGLKLEKRDYFPQLFEYHLDYNLPEKFITVHYGCDNNRGILKLWDIRKWEILVSKLKSLGIEVIQLGIPADTSIAGCRKIVAKNIPDLFYILQKSSLHIDTEGGLVHIAHSVKTKSIVLFNGTIPRLYGYRDNINIYKNKCPSCWWACKGWSSKCKMGRKSCINLDNIEPEEVFNYAKKEI